jgi:hypothetical protein
MRVFPLSLSSASFATILERIVWCPKVEDEKERGVLLPLDERKSIRGDQVGKVSRFILLLILFPPIEISLLIDVAVVIVLLP